MLVRGYLVWVIEGKVLVSVSSCGGGAGALEAPSIFWLRESKNESEIKQSFCKNVLLYQNHKCQALPKSTEENGNNLFGGHFDRRLSSPASRLTDDPCSNLQFEVYFTRYAFIPFTVLVHEYWRSFAGICNVGKAESFCFGDRIFRLWEGSLPPSRLQSAVQFSFGR